MSLSSPESNLTVQPVRPALEMPSALSDLGGVLQRERRFLLFIGAAFLLAGIGYGSPQLAMWIGFSLAAYSVVANDSVQTIGTFIASNQKAKWWVLWLFIGGIFLATVTWSWMAHSGDVTFERLRAKGFEQSPTSFGFLQIAAPIFLLLLTRLRMPVSTTFLILSCFATSAEGLGSVMMKSFAGYGVAFGVALVMWLALSRLMARSFTGEAHPMWRAGQWVTSGLLWMVWIMQDAANVAVYLPRSLGAGEFVAFAGVVFLGLGVLFYLRGDRIQQVVTEKSGVVDVRAATVIDLVYAATLYYFKSVNKVPMSTTWVFVGLLAGRELAMALRGTGVRGFGGAMRMIGRDLGYVTVGLVLSLVLAMSINTDMQRQILELVGLR